MVQIYLKVLETIRNLPFNMGMNLLVQVLQGNESNPQVSKTNLKNTTNFGIFHDQTREQLVSLLKSMLEQGFLIYKELPTNKWIKVLDISDKGKQELRDPKGFVKKEEIKLEFDSEPVSEQENQIINSLSFFIKEFNPEQSKAIISESKKLLCVAGAGSGKTTVLTKRIEFLCKFKSIKPERVLAITFTKKAKIEMEDRLAKLQVHNVNIQTFNSFAEKIFQQNWNLIYKERSNIIKYSDRIKLVMQALKRIGLSFGGVADTYFTTGQRKIKSQDQLLFSFVNDCFSVIDYYKTEREEITPFYNQMSQYKEKNNAKILHDVCQNILKIMAQQNLRDYSDQVKDAITIFENFPNLIPKFDHVLVDEYQDVNAIQIALLDLLNPPNIFAVGDPRQAIFGWRGSRINYILDFNKDPNSTTIVLKQNYRSHPNIVGLANKVVKKMNITDQEAGLSSESFAKPESKLFNFARMELEYDFVTREIAHSTFDNNEIFVLARTNKQLADLSKKLHEKKIPHILKTDETKAAEVKKGYVTLATIHAIKGLEAELVFVLGGNSMYFPCKVSDHPVIESLNLQKYDKMDEERRLFYVAITRAKQQLYISYTGKSLTPFIDKESRKFLGGEEFVNPIAKLNKFTTKTKNESQIYAALREWRREMSQVKQVPAYMVLNDKSIEELSSALPINKNELHDIFGLGPRKIQLYGEEILRIVNS
ncbi:exodeoxyribonuclease V subunit gamma [Candidatus Woesearchaeota archaeon]|nr:exodeoxyribonuclease V subunit gamma [Candidatus Woesearchaeota archaeon]